MLNILKGLVCVITIARKSSEAALAEMVLQAPKFVQAAADIKAEAIKAVVDSNIIPETVGVATANTAISALASKTWADAKVAVGLPEVKSFLKAWKAARVARQVSKPAAFKAERAAAKAAAKNGNGKAEAQKAAEKFIKVDPATGEVTTPHNTVSMKTGEVIGSRMEAKPNDLG